MVTRITRMQKKEKKKKGKIHAISIDFASQIPIRNSSHRFRYTLVRYWNSIPTKFFLWKKMAWAWLIAISPDFPWFFRSTPPRFFSFLPVLFKTRKKSKGDDLPSSRDSWNLERNRTEEKRRGGKAKNRETGPGSSDIQLDLRLHKLRIRVCSWIPYIRH